jgi:ABC-type Fe3+-siderophore transport system permease subunit
VEETPDTLVAACQVAALGAAALLLPTALVDLLFDTDFLSILSQAVLAAFACILIVSVWNTQKER